MRLATWIKALDKSHLEGFRQAIFQDPLDITNYGVFADYLEENGDPQAATAVRNMHENLPSVMEGVKNGKFEADIALRNVFWHGIYFIGGERFFRRLADALRVGAHPSVGNVRIGDSVILIAPSGNSRDVIVTDVIRGFGNGDPIALEFDGVDGPVTLPIRFFRWIGGS